MEKTALVSVIVPIYMVQDYLEKCINSILIQTYENLEIILVDDGSKDECGRICDEFANKDKRIKVIHKENGGLSDARNFGIDAAKGQYIVFIDSDDYVHFQMIEYLIKPVMDGEADMSVCGFVSVDENEDIDIEKIECKETIIIDNYEKKSKYYFEDDYLEFTVAWNKLYPSFYFDNIRYPKGKIHEDEFTSYQLLEKADKVAFVKCPLYYYVKRKSSIMGEDFSIKNLDRFEALDQRIRYYANMGNYDWAEKVHSIYRMLFINDIRRSKKGKDYDFALFENSLKRFKYTTLQYVMRYPVSIRHKLGYLFMAIFPKIYLKKRI